MKEHQKIHSRIELCIGIDSYDDLFSDFDSRPYNSRNISDDFLAELRKQIAEADSPANELKLLIPESARKTDIESILIGRLHTFFHKKQQQVILSKRKAKIRDILYFISGSLLMFSAGFISIKKSDNLFMHGLLVITEPTGWFLVWSALDNLVNTYRKKNSEIDFFSGSAKMKISFSNNAS